MSQLYYASKNDDTFKTIEQIHVFVESLVKWLINLSTVTDTKKLVVYFGTGKNSHGTFSTTLVQLSQNIDRINTMVGATVKSDNILVNQTSKLSELYKDVALIINLLKDDSQITNKQLFSRYREMILSFLSGVLDESNDFDSQIKKISSTIIFNKYICEEYFKVLIDASQNESYLANLKSLIVAAGKKSFSKSDEVKKLITKQGADVKVEPIFVNPLEDEVIKAMIAEVNALPTGNPGVRQSYVNLFGRYLFDKSLDDTLKAKLKLLNNSVIRDVLTLPVNDDEVDKYTLVFDTIFRKFNENNLTTADESHDFVGQILNSIIVKNQ